MTSPLAYWKSLGPEIRLRAVGALVLACGCGGAALFYWWTQTRAHVPTIEELMPGYAHARTRERGILMGGFLAGVMDDLEALKQPDTQAIIVAIVAIVIALVCFRIASRLESHHD
jgi:hypothetical protein